VTASLRNLLADRRGVAAVEFAFILPALILLLVGTMETGRLIWTQSVLHYAVEHAARCAAVDVNNCATTAQVQNYAIAMASPVPIPAADFTVTTPACGAQVAASYPFQTVVANLLPYNITLSAQSCFPK
jgi:Flp pilus assembly protein TadG